MPHRDDLYLRTLLEPIEVCATYRPKMGHGKGDGLSLADFQQLYGADPFYSWLGLDNPLMYAAHKAAGGMTSIYRQLGIGCERIFRLILQSQLELGPDQVVWSYTVPKGGGKTRTLSLWMGESNLPM